jgi:HlyD family secretion protein
MPTASIMTLRRNAGPWILVLALLFAPACGTRADATAEDSADDPPADNVDAEDLRVRQGALSRAMLLTGELRSDGGAEVIVPRLPAWETTIRYIIEDGALVEQGDRLVELDTSQIASELDNKLAAREQAINALTSKRAEVAGQLAEREFAVESTAVELRKAEIDASVPPDLQQRRLYEQLQLALNQARVAHEKALADLVGYKESSRAEIEVAEIDLNRAEFELRQARDAIETMVLRAPRAGIAVVAENRREDRKYQEGDTVNVGRTVIEIPDLTALTVEARLSDVDDGKVTPGMSATAVLDAWPDRVFSGSVRSVSPVAQQSSWRSPQRSFAVTIALDEVDPEIMRPGMSVRVQVKGASVTDSRIAPRAALVFREGRVFVRRADGDLTEVMLGPCSATECALVEGPPPGTELEVGP